MDACPTQAIVSPGILDRTRCLQHLSNSVRALPEAWRTLWGDRLYGCSVCQEVCPRNRHVPTRPPRSTWGVLGPSVPLIPLLGMDETAYRARFAGNQMADGWIRVDAIQRNACLALGNLQDPVAIPALEAVLERHPSPLVKDAAAWALGRLQA